MAVVVAVATMARLHKPIRKYLLMRCNFTAKLKKKRIPSIIELNGT